MFHLTVKKGSRWTNWSRNVTASLDYFHYPESIEDIQQLVDSCRVRGKTLRAIGAGHSFSKVACPDDEAVSLDKLRGLVSFDREAMEATFWAGTYLYEAAPILSEIGMGFENMGDIQQQTLAGAVSTGTHGTGIKFGSLSSQVVAWTYIDGNGILRHHRRADDDLSKALSVSLGLFGVLVKLTFRTVPLYSLHVSSRKVNINMAIAEWDESLYKNRHMEWFYFPGNENVQVKEMNDVPLVKQSKESKAIDFISNGVVETAGFKLMSELCRLKPAYSRKITQIAASAIPNSDKKGLYFEIFPSPRRVKFTETEYAIPLKRFQECIVEMHELLKAHPFYVHFPIECRTTAGEDALLSPTQGEESAFIAFHMYKGMDNGPYFKWVNRIMKSYGGRPHFGKMNNLTYTEMVKLYPKIDLFKKLRKESDPYGVFMTSYFREILGE